MMIRTSKETLADLYLADETAWLDANAELIGADRIPDLDYAHLKEFLQDMANRDRREVKSRLRILIAHLLEWTYQSELRTASWHGEINVQRDDLEDDLQTSRTLRNHAEAILAETYAKAVNLAVVETGLGADAFPAECPWTLDQLLSAEVLDQ